MPFPSELLEYRAWVTWKAELRDGKITKVPYNPVNGSTVSVTDTKSLVNFDQINGHAHEYAGAGFVFTPDNPFCGFDADNPLWDKKEERWLTPADPGYEDATKEWQDALTIARALNSYTEVSPSGRGFHVIFRGRIPEGWGKRLRGFEFYSEERYFTITGNHIEGTPTTINDAQLALEQVMTELGLDKRNQTKFVSQPMTVPDGEVWTRCMHAATSDAFRKLYAGDLTGYPSGSEADLAFANFICFQTDNFEQAERVFRSSPYFAARTKLHDRPDLVTRAITKGFDLKPPPIDFSGLLKTADAIRAQGPTMIPANELIADERPPGIMGMMAEAIYHSSPRPCVPVAIAAAIGLMAGICGRAWNTYTGAGLNLYIVLLADSGVGKEQIGAGTLKLMNALKDKVPSCREFIGPTHLASGSGLRKAMVHQKSFVSHITEFGRWLSVHTGPKAGDHHKTTVTELMSLYHKSGRGDESGAMVYSDKDKNVASVKSPAFSFVAESVPELFYASVTEETLSGGLIPRLMIMEYTGLRPDLNELAGFSTPSPELMMQMQSLVTTSLALNQKDEAIQVPCSAQGADILNGFNRFCDEQHRSAVGTAHKLVSQSVWNRAHLKALRLATLAALSRNWHHPEVSGEDAQWAKALALRDAFRFIGKYKAGEVTTGNSSNDRHRSILTYFKGYIRNPLSPNYKGHNETMHKNGVMAESLLINKAGNNKSFHQSMKGTADSVRMTLKEMSELGILNVVQPNDSSLYAITGLTSTRKTHYVLADLDSIADANM